MNKQVIGILEFLVILSIYVLILVVLAPLLPILFLTVLLAWLLIRRPITCPNRVDSDIKALRGKCSEVIGQLIEVLIRPLNHGP